MKKNPRNQNRTHYKMFIHLTWHTKRNQDILTPDIRTACYRFLYGRCRCLKTTLLAVGGTANHVHTLVSYHPAISVEKLVGDLKGSVSYHLNNRTDYGKISWQRGYGAFTVSEKRLAAVIKYIERQEDHHRLPSRGGINPTPGGEAMMVFLAFDIFNDRGQPFLRYGKSPISSLPAYFAVIRPVIQMIRNRSLQITNQLLYRYGRMIRNKGMHMVRGSSYRKKRCFQATASAVEEPVAGCPDVWCQDVLITLGMPGKVDKHLVMGSVLIPRVFFH